MDAFTYVQGLLYNGGKRMGHNLYSILKPYDNWLNDKDEEINQEAKKALSCFYKELVTYKPEEKYNKRDISHTSYIRFLVEAKKAINEKKYMRACNELISLMHYEPFLQGRIYYNILDLLEEGGF